VGLSTGPAALDIGFVAVLEWAQVDLPWTLHGVFDPLGAGELRVYVALLLQACSAAFGFVGGVAPGWRLRVGVQWALQAVFGH
jgi:hypothetical protein